MHLATQQLPQELPPAASHSPAHPLDHSCTGQRGGEGGVMDQDRGGRDTHLAVMLGEAEVSAF